MGQGLHITYLLMFSCGYWPHVLTMNPGLSQKKVITQKLQLK